MIYLLFSILASTLIYIGFKLFSVFKINTLQAIIVNYFVAACAGLMGSGGSIEISKIPSYSWFPGTLILGILFIVIFNLMAITIQRCGLSVVSVATKMSVVIPIVFGTLYYGEAMGVLKLVGILLALVALYLASAKNSGGLTVRRKNIVFPLTGVFWERNHRHKYQIT